MPSPLVAPARATGAAGARVRAGGVRREAPAALATLATLAVLVLGAGAAPAAPAQDPARLPPTAPEEARPGPAARAAPEVREVEEGAGRPAAEEPVPEAADEGPRTPEAWARRCAALARGVRAGERPASDADALLGALEVELRRALEACPGAFRGASAGSDPLPAGETAVGGLRLGSTVGELHDALGTLYRARLELLPVVTPGLRAELTGTGVAGVRQLALELAYCRRELVYQRIAIPEGLRQVLGDLRTAPLPTVLSAIVALLALALFRSWRRWAGKGIPRLRQLLRRARRDHPAARPLGRLLFTLERARGPLEWMALFAVLFHLIDVPEVQQLEGALRIVVFWVLFAWLCVQLADAASVRDERYGSESRSPARLRSLCIVATWAVFLGLGLDLTAHVAGKGTLHAWVWDLFALLAVPVTVLLLLVWRPALLERLEHEARFSGWAARLARRRGLFGDVLGSLGGLVYLGVLAARRSMLRLLRRTALGRTLVAEALRQSMTRGDEDEAGAPELPPLDAELRKRWLHGESLVACAGADELQEVLDRLARGWSTLVVVADRGGGKSTFLRRLAEQVEGPTLTVTCPHGGAAEAHSALCRSLGIDEPDPSPEAVLAAVKERGVRLLLWDDVHRITRPVLRGQAELDRLLDLLALLQDVPVVASMDSAAWEYVSRVREGTLTGASAVELLSWTESEIGELLEVRAREVGMELDYGRLSVPRFLLEHDFASPEEGVRASYRRILWAEADGNPEVALRLALDSMVENEEGDALLRLPRTRATTELESMTLVELLALRFLVQTDGAAGEELVSGLRYPAPVVRAALDAAEMRGLLDENHGRYRVSWAWYGTVKRVLARRNLLGSARQRDERAPSSPPARGGRAVVGGPYR